CLLLRCSYSFPSRRSSDLLFVLTVVVFVHELGHFLVARWCGVRVLVFSVGFGRELVGLTDRHGTRWKLAAVPLGGYVKFFGDEKDRKSTRLNSSHQIISYA